MSRDRRVNRNADRNVCDDEYLIYIFVLNSCFDTND